MRTMRENLQKLQLGLKFLDSKYNNNALISNIINAPDQVIASLSRIGMIKNTSSNNMDILINMGDPNEPLYIAAMDVDDYTSYVDKLCINGLSCYLVVLPKKIFFTEDADYCFDNLYTSFMDLLSFDINLSFNPGSEILNNVDEYLPDTKEFIPSYDYEMTMFALLISYFSETNWFPESKSNIYNILMNKYGYLETTIDDIIDSVVTKTQDNMHDYITEKDILSIIYN